MASLDLTDGALGGALARYSIIHIPPERIPETFAEFHRVLAPGGYLLLAFQAGDELPQLAEVARSAPRLTTAMLPESPASIRPSVG